MGSEILRKKRFLFGAFLLVTLIFCSLVAPAISKILSIGPNEQNISARFLPPFSQTGVSGVDPIRFHLAGTDEIGRDVFVRLFFAARVSLGVAVLVALSSALLGALIGGVAGFCGGLIDTVLMRLTDSLLSLPQIPIMIILAAIDLKKLPGVGAMLPVVNESIFKLCLVMVLFSWMPIARLMRAGFLSSKNLEYVQGARAIGASNASIMWRHIFPNVARPLLAALALGVGDSIMVEAALSFLGLGVSPPTASWGNMLNNAQEAVQFNFWLALLPGLLIFLTVLSVNLVGDGLQSALDLRRR